VLGCEGFLKRELLFDGSAALLVFLAAAAGAGIVAADFRFAAHVSVVVAAMGAVDVGFFLGSGLTHPRDFAGRA